MIDQPPPELRRIQILAHVRRNGGASISQLAREYSISPVTVTVVTNSPAIAYELHESNIHLVVTPGEVDQVMRLISGGWTEDFLSRLHFQAAFVSAAGLSLERGLTTTRQSLAGTLRAAR